MSAIPSSVVNPYVGEFLGQANPQPPTDQPNDGVAMKMKIMEDNMDLLRRQIEQVTFTVQERQLGEGDETSSYCKLR